MSMLLISCRLLLAGPALLLLLLAASLTSANPIIFSRRSSSSNSISDSRSASSLSSSSVSSQLQPRSPVSASIFTNWPTNVVMLGGAQQFGLWVQPNSGWHSLCNITCLDLPAYALGACCSPTIDAIGVAAGTGTCDFVGVSGWSATISDHVGAYTPVGPPQTIVSANCYS